MSDRGWPARLLPFVLALLSLAVFLSYWDYGINDDEGYLLGGVTRILDGQVPYRDYHHTYGPGRFYLVAFLFRLFGENLLVVRGLWVALKVATVLLAWFTGRRFLSTGGAAAAALLFIVIPGPWHKSFFHFFLLANLLALGGLSERGRGTVAAAGFLAGLTFLFRQDLGIFVVAVYGLLFLLGRWTGETPRRAGAYFLFALFPIVPFLIYFAWEGALGAAAEKVLLAGMRDNRTNALPFPPLFQPVSGGASGLAFLLLRLLYYLPVPLCVVAGIVGAGRVFRGNRTALPLFLTAVLGILAFNQSLWRSDLAHLFQSLGPFWLLAVWSVDAGARRRGWPVRAAVFAIPVVVHLALASYASVYRSPGGRARVASEKLQPIPPYYTGSIVQVAGPEVRLPYERAPLRTSPDHAGFLRAIGESIDRYSERGDYMLTLPGYQLFYFLFDRVNPTAYVHLRRALDTPGEEERYIADLLGKPTKVVLLREQAIDGKEERRLRVYAGGICDAVEREFERVERFGDLVVYRRKEPGS